MSTSHRVTFHVSVQYEAKGGPSFEQIENEKDRLLKELTRTGYVVTYVDASVRVKVPA